MAEKFREKIGVIGAGAWGTALAARISGDFDVILWAHEAETAHMINKNRENQAFLPDISLPDGIRAVNEFSELSACKTLFFAPPAQFLRAIARDSQPHIDTEAEIIICAKGIEAERGGTLLSEVLAEELPDQDYAILSGPSFAAETARSLPTALTLAAEGGRAARLSRKFSSPHFRLYPSDDMIGVQLGGAVKNVIAIACGIAEGRALGQNARAALIARGLAETAALARKMGGQMKTLLGLSGLGDMVLTCTSLASRNTSLGHRLGKGEKLADILNQRQSVSEGVASARAIAALAERHHIAMPICCAVDDILSGSCDIDSAIAALLNRDIPPIEIAGDIL